MIIEFLLCFRSSIWITLFNPHNYFPNQEDEKMKVLERLDNLPKKYNLNSGSLTQETTFLTTILFLSGVIERESGCCSLVNK